MNGRLSIVATPIGNLGDITSRAIEVLGGADVVCAEDTRVTGKLLKALDIQAKLERCDENVIASRCESLVERMLAGEWIAFCSDAGMPGVSDPGIVLVDAARKAGVEVEVLPGASAVPTALVASGFHVTAFYFGGFTERKEQARLRQLEALRSLDAALIFYESPHRVAATARSIAQVFPQRKVALCRELTKLHEEVVCLPSSELALLMEERGDLKGECVIVIGPPSRNEGEVSLDDPTLLERIREQLAAGASKSRLAKDIAREFGVSKNEVYDLLHSL